MKITLKAARVNKGMTQDEAAKAFGISRNTLGNWESGKTSPDGVLLHKIGEVYECNLNDIFLPQMLTKS